MPTVLTVQAHQKDDIFVGLNVIGPLITDETKISCVSICRSLVIAVFLGTKSFSDMYVQEYVYIYIYYILPSISISG